MFHDIKLYATIDSIDNLKGLAEHDYLRNHVRCIYFIHPKLVGLYCDAPAYMDTLSADWKRELYRTQYKIDRGELVTNTNYPWSSKEIWAGLEAYRRAYAQQEFVLKELYGQMVGDQFLSRFPKFSRVCISELDDTSKRERDSNVLPFSGTVVNKEPTWLTKNHPEVLLRSMDISYDDHNAGNSFVYQVLDVLHLAQVQPKELIFQPGHGIGPNFEWLESRDSKLLSKLQTLGLRIRGVDFLTPRITPDWNALLRPITDHCHRLEALYIHIDPFILPEEQSISGVLETVRLPLLSDFHLTFQKVSATAVANFLRAHPLLEELSHWSGQEVLEDHNWVIYWKAIHEHPKLCRMNLLHFPRWEGFRTKPLSLRTELGGPDTEVVEEGDEEIHQALYDYVVHRKGTWTLELGEYWGQW